MVDALVLSGGASHGDFEVGAVRRLFDAAFQPALVVSASVGSVNAIELCQMGALATSGGPSALEQIWLNLQTNSSMYVPNSDFDLSAFDPITNQIQGIGLDLQEDYTWRLLGLAGGGLLSGGLLFGPAGAGVGLVVGLLSDIFRSGNDFSSLASAAQALMDALQKVEQAQSIYLVDPIGYKLFENIDPVKVAASPIHLLMAVVSLESGDLRYITGSGAVMEEDTQTPYQDQFSVNQLCQTGLNDYDSALADLRQVKSNRSDYTTTSDWLKAVAAAQANVDTAKAALDGCRRAHPGPVTQPVTTDVRRGALASASIPMIFMPVKIGNDNYVDGGTRNQVPISGAIAAAKAMAPGEAITIWAIDCNFPFVGPAVDPLSHQLVGSFDTANFIQIADRAAADIMPYQMQLDNDAAVDTRSATVMLVRPESKDIHTGFTVDPGLIRIRMAHGYMRTDDVMFAQVVFGDTTLDSANQISKALYTTDIVGLRYKIWYHEHDVVGWQVNQDPDETINAPTSPATPSVDQQALADVRQMKGQLRQLVTARVNGVNPDGNPIILNGQQLNTLFGAASPGGRIPEQPIPSNAWWLQWEEHQPSASNVVFSTVAPELWGFGPWEDWTGGPYFGTRGTFFADVTGDGKADAIVVNDNTVTVRRSTGSGFGAPEDWTGGPYFGTRGTFFADVTGDGKADAIVVNDNTVTVRRSTGSGFGPYEDWTHGAYYGTRGAFFADVTGDGKADAIVVNDNTVTVRRSTGSGFGPYEDWTGGPYFGTRGTFFADVTGDGKADAIVVNDNTVTVRRSTGSGFGPYEDWTGGPYFGTRGTFFADVTGDGKADAIVVNDNTVTVRRSTGSGFGAPEDWTGGPYFGTRGTFFADVTGDGKADAIVVNDNTVTVRRAT